jgi:hypothetical protein
MSEIDVSKEQLLLGDVFSPPYVFVLGVRKVINQL